MRDFRFESIWLLSHRDGTARTVSFHPRKNLIVGRNHTGKSSLIRPLFETLGADPVGTLERWDRETVSMVEFVADGVRYRALHKKGTRALFDQDDRLLLATGQRRDWSERFASITGFNLVLRDKNSEAVAADPGCFFLPFYVNQDGSWQSGWNTFKGLQRFKSPHAAILDYFCGVKPPEYYSLRAERDERAQSLDELVKEDRSLERARARFSQSMALSGPKVQPDNFESEIDRLTIEVTLLNKRQETLRERVVREQEVVSDLELQIRLANTALRDYDRDMTFLQAGHSERLVCPTCGAEHNSFRDILTYAEDARVLRETAVRLGDDLAEAKHVHSATKAQLHDLEENYRRISDVLDTRRGDLQFRQVVESMGAESAFRAFEDESQELGKRIREERGLLAGIEHRLKRLANAKRTREITDRFRICYTASRTALNLPSVDASRLKLSSRPDLSGSGGPRSILAYYSALWRTCQSHDAAFLVPVVIDSPNQQAQDDINLPRVLKFVSQDLPIEGQLIVAWESGADDSFDNTISLEEPYGLLDERCFGKVVHRVGPMEDAMFSALLAQDGSTLFSE